MPVVGGFKIADGYVQISAQIDHDDHRRTARLAGGVAGDAYGRAFWGAGGFWLFRFRRALSLAVPSQITITLPKITAQVALIVGLAAALVSLASSAGLAASSIAVLLPLIFSFVSVAGILRMMLGKLQDPIMDQVLKKLNALKDEIRQVAIAAAMPGFKRFLEAAVTLGPLAVRYIEQLSRHIGETATALANLMQTEAFRGKLQRTLDGVSTGTRQWLLATEPLVEVLLTLTEAVTPQFIRLSTWIRRTAENWRNLLNLKSETGELQAFFTRAGDEAARWGRIFRDLIMGIVGILVGAHEPGQRMAAALERMAAAFREWAWREETHGKIRDLLHFIHGIDFLKIFQVAASIIALGLALKGLSIGLGIIQGLLVLTALGPLGLALGALGLTLGALALAFVFAYTESEIFRQKVAEAWTWIQDNVFPIIAAFWGWLTQQLAPALREAWEIIEGPLKEAFESIMDTYRENEEELKFLFEVLKELAEFLIGEGIPALAVFAVVLIHDVAEAIGVVITVLGWLSRGIQALAGWTLRAHDWLRDPMTGAIDPVVGSVRTLIGWVGSAVDALARMWRWLREHVFEVRVKLPSVDPMNIRGLVSGLFSAHGGIVGGGGAFAGGGIVGGMGRFQAGGVTGTRNVVMNERGPEAVRLPIGSTVIPHGQTVAMLDKETATRTVVLRSDGSKLSELIIEMLRSAVRDGGGDVQFVLGQ